MTEFEKWWIKEKAKDYAGIPNYVSARAENLSYINDREIWKAALECVRNKVCQKTWHPDSNIRDFIDYELKQLNQSNSQSDNSPQSDSPS